MPYKDPVIAKQKAKERKEAWQKRECEKRIAAGFPEDGRGKHGNQVKGSGHPKWNTSLINEQGYALIRVGKSHPLADPNGYAPEHVVVVMSSESPGAYLLRTQPDVYVIHHKNEDKLDNRIENLPVITRAEHNKIHMKGRRDEKTGRLL